MILIQLAIESSAADSQKLCGFCYISAALFQTVEYEASVLVVFFRYREVGSKALGGLACRRPFAAGRLRESI